MKTEWPTATTDWIDSYAQLPTRKDANQNADVIATYRSTPRQRTGYVRIVKFQEVRENPWAYPFWISAPKDPVLPRPQ